MFPYLSRVCECFHMPFQAGDNEILSRMRRGYTYESYLHIIHKIRSIAGIDASNTTDNIVGFPGETEKQFKKTLDVMNMVQFDNVNSFIYSSRPYTKATTYDDPISYDIKMERLQKVQSLAQHHALIRSHRYLHRTVKVLFEDINPKYHF
jgi:tRNA-2-methylthio-N6-dimethylallyladenosine synthase